MSEFDKRLNEALSGYVETEYSSDVPHEYAPENGRKAEEMTSKSKKNIQRRFPMKKRFAAALVCALVLVSSAVVYAASPAVREYINMLFLREDSAGRLTEVPDGYTGVYTAEDLDNVRNDLNGKYILMNDIDLTEEDYEKGGVFEGGFVPIGSGQSPYASQPFYGIFNGNGYVISGLIIDGSYDYAGLFGYTKRIHTGDYEYTAENRSITGGIIKNLGLVNSSINITGAKNKKAYIGGIAGYADYVIGCYTDNFTINVALSDDIADIAVGGVAGRAYFVDSCYSTADISFSAPEDAENVYISGIAGYSFSCVTSYFNGTIDCGEYPDYGVTYCQQYDVPIVLTEPVLNEITRRLDLYPSDDPRHQEAQERYGHSWNSQTFNAFYCSSEYLAVDISLQNYITEKDEGMIYYLLDPTLKNREYQRLSELLALAFPDNTFREFCIEHHIKSGYYACYDLRDTPDCTFDGFDFDFIWCDRTSPKLRLFREEKKSDAMTAYENGWIKIKD